MIGREHGAECPCDDCAEERRWEDARWEPREVVDFDELEVDEDDP